MELRLPKLLGVADILPSGNASAACIWIWNLKNMISYHGPIWAVDLVTIIFVVKVVLRHSSMPTSWGSNFCWWTPHCQCCSASHDLNDLICLGYIESVSLLKLDFVLIFLISHLLKWSNMGILTRTIHNHLRPFAWTPHPIDVKQLVQAFYIFYNEERIKLLHTMVAPIDVFDTQLVRLPQTAVAACLMILWVVISSSQDSEFLGGYDDSFEIVHAWLRANYASKTAPVNKGEATVAHSAAALRIRRVLVNNCQFEVCTTFNFKNKKQDEIKQYMNELFRFNGGTDLTGILRTAKSVNSAFVAFSAFKEEHYLKLPIVAITGSGEGRLISLQQSTACNKYVPVLLRTTKLGTKYFPVLLRTTKLAQSTWKSQFISFWRSNLISCERVVTDTLKWQYSSVFDDRTSFRAKGLRPTLWNRNIPEFLTMEPHFVRKGCGRHFEMAIFLSFWRSNLISCERVAFRGASLALPRALREK